MEQVPATIESFQEQISGYHEFGTPEQVTALYAALGAAQGKFGQIKRSKEVYIRSEKGNYKFAYAPLEDLIAATRPALTEVGLTVLTPAINESLGAKVLIILAHKDGGRLVSEFRFMPANDIKQTAGVITYVRRYGYSSILCLAADDDADDHPAQDQTSARPVDRATGEILTCEECNAELQDVRFQDGTIWSPIQLAQYGRRKHGRVLCMSHYRAANEARKVAETMAVTSNGGPSDQQADAYGSMTRAELQQRFAAEWKETKAVGGLEHAVMQTELASGWTGEILKVPPSKIKDHELPAVIAELIALRATSVPAEPAAIADDGRGDEIPW